MSLDEQYGIIVRTDIHPSLHPGMVRGEHIEQDTRLVDSVRSAFANAYTTLAAINDAEARVGAVGKVRQGKKINKNDHASINELRSRADKHWEKASKLLDKVHDSLTRKQDELEAQITEQIASKKSDPLASEIRTHIKTSKNPYTAANKLIVSGDLQVTRAVLAAPHFLSGLTEDNLKALTAAARHKFMPVEVALLGDIEKNVGYVEQAGAKLLAAMSQKWELWERAHVSKEPTVADMLDEVLS